MAIRFLPGSYANTVLEYIALCGEFPWDSIHMIKRNRRMLIRAIRNLRKEGYVTVNGSAEMKTIRLTKKAFEPLSDINPLYLEHYLGMTENHRFRGGSKKSGNSGANQTWRRHRMAEILCLLKDLGVNVWDYQKAPLHLDYKKEKRVSENDYVFYTSRQLKNVDEEGAKKVGFTRIMGTLFSPGGVYCVYHTNKGLIRWQKQGEIKAQLLVEDIVNLNYDKDFESNFLASKAIMFGKSMEVAIDILESNGGKRTSNGFELLSFDNTYRDIYFLTLDERGERQLEFMMKRNWHEKLKRAIFPEEIITSKYSSVDCDAMTDDAYILMFFDGNIGRLKRFKQASGLRDDKRFEILCYPWQEEHLKNYMPNAIYRTMELEDVVDLIK